MKQLKMKQQNKKEDSQNVIRHLMCEFIRELLTGKGAIRTGEGMIWIGQGF